MESKTTRIALPLLAAVLVLAGCEESTGPSQPTLRDLQVALSSMSPHVGQLMEFRVISSDGDLVAAAVVDTLDGANLDFTMPSALPEGEARLDFYADLSMNGSYDAPTTDHAWRDTLAATGNIMYAFTHNTSFTDIASPAYTERDGDFTIDFTGMTPHVGQLLELRVIEDATGQTVGYYRLAELPSAAFSLTIPGIIDGSTAYRVDFYADLDMDGTYDAPPTDHAWRVTQTSGAGAAGLTVAFAHNVSFTDIGW